MDIRPIRGEGICSEPFDEHDLMPIVDLHHQPVVVAFNVEDHSVGPHDAGVRIGSQNIGWLFPMGSEHFVQPDYGRSIGNTRNRRFPSRRYVAKSAWSTVRITLSDSRFAR